MRIIITLCLVLLTQSVIAQTTCPCCDDNHRQFFDFWVGEWDVYDTNGKRVGGNSITKIEDNCVLQEKWTGAFGTTGTSFNYYDPADSSWHQLWLDNSGNNLKLTGGLNAKGEMVMKSELLTSESVGAYYNQITWSEEEDGTVSQVWETFAENGKQLATIFHGVYRRKE